MENKELMEFLEDTIRGVLQTKPKRVVVAFLDENNGVTFSYKNW